MVLIVVRVDSNLVRFVHGAHCLSCSPCGGGVWGCHQTSKLCPTIPRNKLKSLKVAQVKDEMDDDEDDGCDVVCDVVL